MELRLARYFLAVADLRSVTRAAAHLRVAQPSLSRQLRGLETELGCRLFDRGPGGVRLTPAGEHLLPMARDLVARVEAAEVAMEAFAAGQQTPFSVVAPATTVADVVAPFLATSGPDAPSITVREELPSDVFDALAAGEADLAISSGPPPGAMASRPLVRFAVWAYVPRQHRWSRRRRLPIAELVAEPLVVLGPEHGTRRVFDGAVAAAGVAYRRAHQTDSPQIAQALAASGHGVAIVSDDPRYGLHAIGIVGADGELVRIPLFAAWNPTGYAAATIGPWVDALTAFCAVHFGAEPRVDGSDPPALVEAPAGGRR